MAEVVVVAMVLVVQYFRYGAFDLDRHGQEGNYQCFHYVARIARATRHNATMTNLLGAVGVEEVSLLGAVFPFEGVQTWASCRWASSPEKSLLANLGELNAPLHPVGVRSLSFVA